MHNFDLLEEDWSEVQKWFWVRLEFFLPYKVWIWCWGTITTEHTSEIFKTDFTGLRGRSTLSTPGLYLSRDLGKTNRITCWYFSVFVVVVNHFIIKCNNPSKHLIVITSTDWELSLTMLVIVLIVNTFITLNFNIILCLGPFLHSSIEERECLSLYYFDLIKQICII